MMNTRRLFWLLTLLLAAALLVAACGSSSQPVSDVAAAPEEHNDDDEHHEEAEHNEHNDEAAHQEEAEGGHTHSPDDHMAAAHNVPEEAAAVPNPVAANEGSIAAGGSLFTASCAVCHGENGHGDGPGAAGLEKQPANLTEGHVQALSDGALFYIISHGKPETPMPAWEEILNEEERWKVVNFLRTLE